MNTETITMPPSEALKKLHAYKSYLRKTKLTKANSEVIREFKEAERAYEELAKGKQLVNVDDVIQRAPVDSKNRPMLAIARADCKQIKFQWDSNWSYYRFAPSSTARYEPPASKTINIVHNLKYPSQSYRIEGYALVPMIPADVMPERIDLSKHWILWEVEKWSDTSLRSEPSRDPFLLRHIGGPLYAIIAEWDLTDLERTLVLGRRE